MKRVLWLLIPLAACAPKQTVKNPGTCPNWSKPGINDFANGASSNFGCASNADLAAMLVREAPQHPGPADGEAAAKGVEDYRANRYPAATDAAALAASPSGAGSSGSP